MSRRLTREEFRLWAAGQSQRHERASGEPVAMPPERVVHARLKARIWQALDRAIREKGLDCEAFPDGVTIEIDDDTDYEPDAVVNRGARLDPYAVAASNPVIVVEVLSPATQSIDSGDKLADYFRVPSIQHYLVVRSKRREIIHHRRSGAGIVSRPINIGAIVMDPPGISIDVAEVYADAL